MNFINLMYNYSFIIHIIFILNINSLSIFQSSLKREIRYTKFNFISQNTSIFTVKESTIKQYYDGQRLFIHVIVHRPITEFHVNYNIIKCKDHYIDCYNILSYDICQGCSKLNIIQHLFINITRQNVDGRMLSCPIYGDYNYRNLSVDTNIFGPQISLSTEKYWQNYWKINVNGYNEDNLKLTTMNVDFYFIEFRSRRRLK